MSAFHTMNQKIIIYTLGLTLVSMVISSLIFHNIIIALGILIGSLTGLLGYFMIVKMAGFINENTTKQYGIVNYFLRFLVYGIIFVISVLKNISIIALLIGMTCHKLAIVIYAVIEGKKEDVRS